MIYRLFSVYDEKTKTYTVPFFAQTNEIAKRTVLGSFSSTSQLVLYPSDYILYCLGSIDDTTGAIEPVSAIRINAISELIPVALRKFALDGTFGKDDENEK